MAIVTFFSLPTSPWGYLFLPFPLHNHAGGQLR